MVGFFALVFGAAVSLVVWAIFEWHQQTFRRQGAAQAPSSSRGYEMLRPYVETLAGVFRRITSGARGYKQLPASPREPMGHSLRRAVAGVWLEFRGGLQSLCERAGHPNGIGAEELMGTMIAGGAVGLFAGAVLTIRIPTVWFVLIFGSLGFVIPLMWTHEIAEKRQEEMRRFLPVGLELLNLSVQSGMDFAAALALVAAKKPENPLCAEIGRSVREIRIGKTRRAALRDMERRAHLAELTPVVQALVQADEMGSDLGPILSGQAEQLRVKRAQRAEKRAQEAPVKMLFPLLVFIFPNVFIVIFGPLILRFMGVS